MGSYIRQERNIIEAASKGASQSISLIANIAVNLIAFIALVEFLNQTLIWFGNRIGMEKPDDELTFQVCFINYFSSNRTIKTLLWIIILTCFLLTIRFLLNFYFCAHSWVFLDEKMATIILYVTVLIKKKWHIRGNNFSLINQNARCKCELQCNRFPCLQFLCSYVFYPVAFLMGVDQVDCFDVAQLIGYKTFINEFYAYTKLSVFIKNQENLTW